MENFGQGGVDTLPDSVRIADVLVKLVTQAEPEDEFEFKRILLDGRLQSKILAFAEANGLYYAAACRIRQLGIPLVDAQRWALELRNVQEIRDSIAALNVVSAESGIEYTLIKEYRVMPNAARDVDVLVHEKDRMRLIEELRARGFILLHSNSAETSLAASTSKRIDVYTRIQYLEKDFVREGFLWNSVVQLATHGISHPGLSRTSSLLVNSIHGILGHPHLTLLDYLDLRDLLKDPQNVEACRKLAHEEGWLGLMDAWIKRIDRLGSESLAPKNPARFPVRNGIFFTFKSISYTTIVQMNLTSKFTLLLSLLWDDAIHVAEKSGIARVLKSSPVASTIANRLGHGLRQLRGDRKHSYPESEDLGGM